MYIKLNSKLKLISSTLLKKQYCLKSMNSLWNLVILYCGSIVISLSKGCIERL